MRAEFKCIAVVHQGVDKVLINTTDALAIPEEQSILNLSKERGAMEPGEYYELIINKIDRPGR